MDEMLMSRAVVAAPPLAAPLEGEGLFAFLRRTTGAVRREDFARVLGYANEYKEGDAAIGVAAPDAVSRERARALIRATRVAEFDSHVVFTTPLFDDALAKLLYASLDSPWMTADSPWTFGDFAQRLGEDDAWSIGHLVKDLTTEAIATVVKLLSNEELADLSAEMSRSLPGSDIGSATCLGARLQPNSPTDHPDDIRWQVFCGWSYGVGDVLLGTNPVSSDPESVLRVELALKDIIDTFGLADVLPHCVLSHIDVQAEVERMAPESTALWFQSIAGSDAANQTFGISVDSMMRHAASRTGRFGLYFETGQGADFTNGHGHGVDMVVHEARKYGFARGLRHGVDEARLRVPGAKPWEVTPPWVIVNDVAGFIGPEVFRTKEQLVRCCLEDLVMGKLHGLTIGLDVCATLHMDITLDDLDWCLEQVMPACPAYLMALPTKVDPMLGYLTTGFQDHVRLRAKFGKSVNAPMLAFFQSIGALDADGNPGPHFGDPLHVYMAYQRRRGDVRDDSEIRAEGARQVAEVRARGVFIAEGQGARAEDLAPSLDRQIRGICDDARLALWARVSPEFVATVPGAVPLVTRSRTREEYILHPVSGESFSEASLAGVQSLRDELADVEVQLVVSDGLNPLAITEPGQLLPFLAALREQLDADGWRVSPRTLVVEGGRVRAGYGIGEALFGGMSGRRVLVHVIGERPGTGHHTFSAYVTAADGAVWAVPGAVDHDITRVISGVALTALRPEEGAGQVAAVLRAMLGAVHAG